MLSSQSESLPPVPPSDLAVVHVDALAAALLKLGITNVSATTLLDTVKQESMSKHKVHTTAERRKALLKLASQPDETRSGAGSVPPYKSVFVEHPDASASSDQKSKERRRRLRALAQATFPDGKIPDPYTSVWLNEFDGADKDLPFILATVVVTPLDDDSDHPPEQRFENVWCLWDTGAQVSQILGSQLDPRIRGGQMSGQAILSIKFSGLEYTFESLLAFREHLPNNATVMILGQHALLNRLQYTIQPYRVNPNLKTIHPAAYGQINLMQYADPVNDDDPNAGPINL